jgi:protocatechuate 3,4-dioxygenase beta subunit
MAAAMSTTSPRCPPVQIRGRVLGPDGKALPTASVELYRTGRYEDAKSGWWEFQTENGGFNFEHVATGDYLLVFNRQNHRDPNSPYQSHVLSLLLPIWLSAHSR